METTKQSLFKCTLDKKGRGRGFKFLKNWSTRTIVIDCQTLSYFDGDEEKGRVDLAGCSACTLSNADPDADGMPLPFGFALRLKDVANSNASAHTSVKLASIFASQTSDGKDATTANVEKGERIVFCAASADLRDKLVVICETASLFKDWAVEVGKKDRKDAIVNGFLDFSTLQASTKQLSDIKVTNTVSNLKRLTLERQHSNLPNKNLFSSAKDAQDRRHRYYASKIQIWYRLKLNAKKTAVIRLQRSWRSYVFRRDLNEGLRKSLMGKEIQIDAKYSTYVDHDSDGDDELYNDDDDALNFDFFFSSSSKSSSVEIEKKTRRISKKREKIYSEHNAKVVETRLIALSSKYMPMAFVTIVRLTVLYLAFYSVFIISAIFDNNVLTIVWRIGHLLYDVFVWLRIYIEVFVLVSIFYMTVHRLLGILITRYLNYLLKMPNGGYNMSVDWISLRLGLDHNEIMIKNFCWHNPPDFKHTPYFLNVGEAVISFKFMSLLNAIRNPRSSDIHINSLQLSHVTCHIEKLKTDELDALNLWACLGCDSTAKKDDARSSILQKLVAAGGGLADVIMKYNPALMLYKGISEGAALVKQKTEKLLNLMEDADSAAAADSNNNNKEINIGSGSSGDSRILNKDLLLKIESFVSRADSGDDNKTRVFYSIRIEVKPRSYKYVIEKTYSEFKDFFDALDVTRFPKLAHFDFPSRWTGQSPAQRLPKLNEFLLIIIKNRADLFVCKELINFLELDKCEGSNNHNRSRIGSGSNSNSNSNSSKNSNSSSSSAASADPPNDGLPPLEYHWGLCYKFLVHRLAICELDLHAQDYLQDQHEEAADHIKINFLCMFAKELVKEVKKGKHGQIIEKQGVYLDDLTWKVINRAILELLDTNKGALMKIVGSAAMNNLSKSVKSKVSTLTKAISFKNADGAVNE